MPGQAVYVCGSHLLVEWQQASPMVVDDLTKCEPSKEATNEDAASASQKQNKEDRAAEKLREKEEKAAERQRLKDERAQEKEKAREQKAAELSSKKV